MSGLRDIWKRMYPAGPYLLEEGTVHDGDLTARAAAYDEAEGAVDALGRELFPDQAQELLPRFERVYGLTPSGAADLAGRRQELLGRIAAQPGISIPAMQKGLLPYVGYLPEIIEYQLQAGDPPEYIYQFTVHVLSSLVTVPINVPAILAAIGRLKPAHTLGTLTFDAFLCDDPYSLTDTASDVLTA